jgi:hypothetical protein
MSVSILHRRREPPPDASRGLRAARALERAVEELDAPGRGLGCVGPEHRALLVAARREMLALSTDLFECPDCAREAAALAWDLARHGAMPLYSRAGARRALEQASAARALLAGAAQRPA